MYQTVHYEKNGSIATLTVDRPEALNALNTQAIAEMEQVIAGVAADPEVRVLIVTGAGRAFVAGADIAQMYPMGMIEGRDIAQKGSHMMRNLEKLEIPTIAAVNGFALGGGTELAMSCDIILASEKAVFGQPEVALGITPGFSGTQRLPRRIGVGRAKEMIYTGRKVKADEALQIGLVDFVYPPEELMAQARALAENIVKQSPIAVKFSKVAINRGLQVDIDSGIAIENEMFGMCFATEDKKEGMGAFLEKRSPTFQNK